MAFDQSTFNAQIATTIRAAKDLQARHDHFKKTLSSGDADTLTAALAAAQGEILYLSGQGASPIVRAPFDTANNVWVFDPDQVGAAQYIIGPTGTVTTPVRTAGAPSYYTFGSSDYIDFGNALETTWLNTVGFTLYLCCLPSAGDIALANQPIFNKMGTGGVNEEIDVLLTNGQVQFTTYYGGSVSAYTTFNSAASALTAGSRYVIALTYDPTLARTSRGVVYKNGAVTSATASSIGSDGVLATGTGPVRLGKAAYSAVVPTSQISYAAAYNGVHSAGTVANVSNWYAVTKGWA